MEDLEQLPELVESLDLEVLPQDVVKELENEERDYIQIVVKKPVWEALVKLKGK